MPVLLTCAMLALLALAGGLASAQGGSGDHVGELTISVNRTVVTILEGNQFAFTTQIRNDGNGTTPPLVASLNVVSLKEGVYVDPEDWSQARSVHLDPLGPGGSTDLTWSVQALIAGDFAVYVAVIPKEPSTAPVVSEMVHVHIQKWAVMPMGGVVPVVVAVPVLLGALYAGQRAWAAIRRRNGAGADPRPGIEE
jgi:hypothetical protein